MTARSNARGLRPLWVLVVVLGWMGVRPAAAVAVPAGPSEAMVDLARKEPYLIYRGDPTQMQVLWQLSTAWTSNLQWGTDSTYSLGSVVTSAYGPDNQHTYTITGLTPGTRYLYRVITYGVTHGGSFIAAPSRGAKNLKFLAYGDTRTYADVHNAVARAMNSAVTADPARQTFTLFMGDYVTTGTSEGDWLSQFFSPTLADVRKLMATVPYFGTMGNHEGIGDLYVKYFPYPFVAGRYWSFDYGPVHVAVLDQYTAYGAGSAQLLWLAADLAASTKPWKIVLLHEPGWSAGGGHANNTAVQTLIQPLCELYDVSIVFCGHNHYYARAVVNGVQHVTTGGGGAPLVAPVLPAANVVFAQAVNEFCTIDIEGGTLRLKAITSLGVAIDSVTLVRPVDVTAPAVALTSPLGGETWPKGSTQSVTWVATDSVGVDSVNVDYSLSGPAGPWLAVAHGLGNTGSTSWTLPDQVSDSALVRITAFDPALNEASVASDTLFRLIDPAGVGRGGPAGLMLARPQPNPGRETVALGFTLPAAGAARLEILDLAGRRVWSTGGSLSAGAHTYRWDGRADGGGRVGAGLYFVRLATPWGTRGQRLVWTP